MFILCVEKINCHLQLVFESFQVGSLFYLSWQVGLFSSFVLISWFFPASSFYSSQLPTLFPSFDAPSPVAVLLSNAVFSRTPVWLFGILKVWLERRVKTIRKQLTSDWLVILFLWHQWWTVTSASFLFFLVHVTDSLIWLGRVTFLEHLMVFSLYSQLSFAVPFRH